MKRIENARMFVHAERASGGVMEAVIWRPNRHEWGVQVWIDGVWQCNWHRTNLAQTIKAIEYWRTN